MNDYKTALKEYQELQYIIKNQLNDLLFLLDKANSFKSGMISIEEHINLSQGNTSDEFFFINPIFNNYSQEIHNIFLSYNEQITMPLKNFIENFTFATNNCLNSFNQIKLSLIESKQKVIKARDEYYNYIKSNQNNEKNKGDQNELFKAKKGNYSQLYKYEINKMNEIISKNNKKYNDIFKTLEGINTGANSIVKNILNRFVKTIGNIGNIFIKLSEHLNAGLNTNLKNIENNIRYLSQIDEQSKMRFGLETFEEYEDKNKKEEILKVENNENKETIEKKDENKKTVNLKRIISLPRKGFDDFEIIEGPLEVMDVEKMKEHIKQLKEIIKKLASVDELLPSEITQLINILKEDTFESNETFSYIFLKKIKEFYKNRVINFKNRQNFIHLANVMNNLCIKEDNTKTFNAIIEVSQMIKYENLFMYCMIQRKNHFFSTKTFWLRVIQDNLINDINNYCKKLLSQKSNKNDNNGKNQESHLLVNIGLDKNIINYNNLNEQHKKSLDKYASESICIILSKALPGMCSFLVPEFISINIIRHYCKLFNLDSNTFKYFQNILEAKNIKNTLDLKNNNEKSKRKKDMFNMIFIISCTLKYLPKNEIINLFPLSKTLKPYIEKKIFKFFLSNKNLTIEKRIEIWGIMLKVKSTIEYINYKTIKNLMKERLEKKEIIVKSQEYKNLDTIEVDLIRTPFINKHKEHMEKVRWVLRCLNYSKPDVGYCQGMNLLALFFYQLLDYDEEKTFYFMISLEMESKYQDIFLDDLRMLKIYFIVLDKLINLYKPEIYYKFIDSYISTNIFSTPWFVTLFTNVESIFEKKNAPKYVLMVMENFILDGWSAIFNSGYTLTRYYFDKIMNIEGDILITFMIKDLCNEDIVKNENFDKIEEHYNKNSEMINELLISKLVKITRYENTHSFIKK